ncbi:hypothetical protein NE237_019406 [Protea cynaroides]|uniref:SRR1-like domain-containing protein n=1 Tax=Protea cynaroides TaxID=273540 RepID=A0A9Q0QPX0_9MAGN|nr:hypothetical protein NE237_019406 [Protea cynaroides]
MASNHLETTDNINVNEADKNWNSISKSSYEKKKSNIFRRWVKRSSKIRVVVEIARLTEEMDITIEILERSKLYQEIHDMWQNNPAFRCNIDRILGSDSNMLMVIYVLGSIETNYYSRFQLALAILLKRDFSHWISGIEVSDPDISSTDAKVMEDLASPTVIDMESTDNIEESDVDWESFSESSNSKKKSKSFTHWVKYCSNSEIIVEDEVGRLPEQMDIAIKVLESSKLYQKIHDQWQNNPIFKSNIDRILGSNSKMLMVIYALGSIESSYRSRFQLALAILLKRDFSDWIGNIEAYDPIISDTDTKVMEALGCNVLSVNEEFGPAREKRLKIRRRQIKDDERQWHWRRSGDMSLTHHVVDKVAKHLTAATSVVWLESFVSLSWITPANGIPKTLQKKLK